jgi:hypothetical protein
MGGLSRQAQGWGGRDTATYDSIESEMIHRKVKLPKGDVFSLFSFTRAIAQATSPYQNLKGIECITGLLITMPPMEEMVPVCLSEDDKRSTSSPYPISTFLSEFKCDGPIDRLLQRHHGRRNCYTSAPA